MLYSEKKYKKFVSLSTDKMSELPPLTKISELPGSQEIRVQQDSQEDLSGTEKDRDASSGVL